MRKIKEVYSRFHTLVYPNCCKVLVKTAEAVEQKLYSIAGDLSPRQ